MNAAARVMHESNIFDGQLANMRMSKSVYLLIIILMMVLVSAFTVIYSTNSYRSTLSKLELEEQQTELLQQQWGQLLLEQASLATPGRVEEMASQKLKMSLPTRKNTYMLQAH